MPIVDQLPRRVALCAALASLLPSVLLAQGDIREAGRLLQRGVQAAAAGDYQAYLADASGAAKLVPPHPALYYHVARAAALSNRPDSALSALEALVAIGAARDPSADTAFKALNGVPRFQRVVEELRRNSAPLVASDTAFVVDVPNLVSENLVFDAKRRVFYVGSMARQMVLESDARGRTKVLIDSTLQIGQPIGMRVDTTRGVLWVPTLTPPDSSKGRFVQRSALLEVELPSGRIRARYAPADSGVPHLLNDIAQARDGTLYITDSEGRRVWRLPLGARALEPWIAFDSTYGYPNGITLSDDDKTLFVAHQTGIVAIDRASATLRTVRPPKRGVILGVDGLYQRGGTLIALQNSTPIPQVIAIRPSFDDASGGETCVRVLERAHAAYEIPTTGTMVGGELYYVANSQLRRLDAQGRLTDPEKSAGTVILRLGVPVAVSCN